MEFPWPTLDLVIPPSNSRQNVARQQAGHDRDRHNSTDLTDLLKLVARAFSVDYAFVLVPSASKTIPSRVPPFEVNWTDVAWHASGRIAERRLRRNLIPTALNAVVSGSSAESDPSRPHLIVSLPGPAATLYGYAGIELRDNWTDAEIDHTRRLLRDLCAGYIQTTRSSASLDSESSYWSEYVRSVHEPMVITTLGEIVHINEAAVELLGGTLPFVFEGRSLDDFVPGSDQAIVRDYSRSDVGDEIMVREHSIIRLDGEERRVEARRRRVECGGRPSMQITFCDITKYWKGLEDLRSLVGTLSEAVVTISFEDPIPIDTPEGTQVRSIRTKGRVGECNTVLCNFYGIEPDAVRGKSIDTLISKAELDLLRTFVRKGYRLENHPHHIQMGEHQRVFQVNAIGKVNKGRLTQILASFSELTDRVDLERLASEVQEMQQEKLGRDLHDSLGPYITGVRLLSGELASRDSLNQDEMRSRVEKIAGFTEEASRQLRKIYNGLVPVAAESGSLTVALSSIAETFNAFSGSAVTFVQYGEFEEIERSRLVQMHRIAQEAVTNALKHAQPTRTEISARREGDELLLLIQDNGSGFDTSVRKSKSLGLENMAWRARSLGGTLNVASQPGEGTTICCRVPLS